MTKVGWEMSLGFSPSRSDQFSRKLPGFWLRAVDFSNRNGHRTAYKTSKNASKEGKPGRYHQPGMPSYHLNPQTEQLAVQMPSPRPSAHLVPRPGSHPPDGAPEFLSVAWEISQSPIPLGDLPHVVVFGGPRSYPDPSIPVNYPHCRALLGPEQRTEQRDTRASLLEDGRAAPLAARAPEQRCSGPEHCSIEIWVAGATPREQLSRAI